VCWRDNAFGWIPGPADTELAQAVADIQTRLPHTLDDGYISEFNPTLGPWVRSIGEVLGRGLVLLIDYGYPRVEYYHPQRRAGTLMCHYRHRAHTDPLVRAGIQDITASVDFTAVADAALDAGMELLGYTTQAWFLLNTGLDQVLVGSQSGDPVRDAGYARQAQVLTLPGEMGERFKVMALGRGLSGPLCGFAAQDQRHRL
jgi:SAM-dependent MidA family methyltransferase